jgi:uncharacterized protein YcaQ
MTDVLSAREARRIALAAQGLADRGLTGVPGRRALRRVIGRVGVLQMDSVNVLVRSHYLPAFSRLGPYDPVVLGQAAYGPKRELFEYWAHEASLVPLALQPSLRWRMARAVSDAWGHVRRIQAEKPGFVESVRALVAERGPVSAGALAEPRGVRAGPWWDWNDTKAALEYLFFSGEVTTASRRGFERLYDLTERVLPADVLSLPTPEVADAQRRLVRVAAAALGVATEGDLRDYFRLTPTDAKVAVGALVESGELRPVRVEGWKQRGFLDPSARMPRRIGATALLSPFDSLIWERSRVDRLFGFHYRLEIYTPMHKRVHGYYVLPFLLGDRLVARVDLKADRTAGVLRVPGAHLEAGADVAEVAPALAGELCRIAEWLGLTDVLIVPAYRPHDPLVRALDCELRSSAGASPSPSAARVR